MIVKNLLDPQKSQDAKYRTLKLDNPKLQSKLFSIAFVRDWLVDGIGFVEEETQCLTITVEQCSNLSPTILQVLQQSLSSLGSSVSNSIVNNNNKKKAVEEKLSEKQKARRLWEERQKLEKLREKEERKKNLAMLRQDKFVRENDANWKSGVSAACAKSGTGLQTFRDRHGEWMNSINELIN